MPPRRRAAPQAPPAADLPPGRPWTPDELAGATLDLAPALLGSYLVRILDGDALAGRIVETEAYLAEDDPASHSHRGPSDRNRAMFGEPGRAYVYRIYGLHHCVNVVTEPAGRGAAVLIRALEPVAGLATMAVRRGLPPPPCGVPLPRTHGPLTNGPGRLCQALAIDRALDHADLATAPLILWRPDGPPIARIAAGPRIGITLAAEHPWRWGDPASPWLSRPLREP